MLLIKIVLVIILGNFLSSCNPPTIEDQKQCSPFFSYKTIDGKEYIDPDESSCFCRMYHWGKDGVGVVPGSETEEPLNVCDRLIGHPPDNYIEVVNYYEALRIYLLRQAKQIVKKK